MRPSHQLPHLIFEAGSVNLELSNWVEYGQQTHRIYLSLPHGAGAQRALLHPSFMRKKQSHLWVLQIQT